MTINKIARLLDITAGLFVRAGTVHSHQKPALHIVSQHCSYFLAIGTCV